MPTLHTQHLSLGYLEQLIVPDLSLAIPEGQITALVGANGSGKSTILKALARILKPRSGAAYLDGKAIHRLSTKQVAKALAILPQNPEAPEGLTVHELVSYGRFPHQRGLGGLNRDDHRAIHKALALTGMTVFAERPVGSLSGGQRQRAWIAMALAQGTDVLLLDEPTTFLDMAHQLEVLQLLERLNREEGRTIVMVVHDLNHASRYAQHMVAIVRGEVAVAGTPAEVMTPENLRRVFAIEADIVTDPRSGVPLCIPYGLRPRDNPSIGL
ncbi:ABC transporter ATP-binding protein [Truepera radiovictrix]|uniref:ABC transporter related protein n=1 Tax=Truepera radiovictrix (strain DSM 17093 / CIP 108686 / LMG 22925 / RQ-24) TaxID=649638 RepID=D7CRJ4_TRURR|nr:ABC transporter ATP-binding protein [Truepera radiovictrix]ADI13484.1 ABC transporter related protein [Truepera radiovictrix DSM 17093]WMT57954.1 ABC transporter ATP-binding protein [Truepera radiovictrix]